MLDDHSEANNTITICRRNPRKGDDTYYANDEYGEGEWFPVGTEEATIVLEAIEGMFAHFDDCLASYQGRIRGAAGQRGDYGPDLSRGAPYWGPPPRREDYLNDT